MYQKNCDKCGEQIVFLKTVGEVEERSIPVDAEQVEAGDQFIDRARHTPHVRNCRGNNSQIRKAVTYALALVILTAAPVFAVTSALFEPDLEDIKGLVLIRKIDKRGEKAFKIFTYELMDGTVFNTRTKIKGATDMTKFDEVHPRWARAGAWGACLGGICGLGAQVGGSAAGAAAVK